MPTKLQSHFSAILSITEKVLAEIKPFDHPLLTLVRTILEEQQENLARLLPDLTTEGKAELPTIKEEISIVYHCHEVANPVFEAWGRANTWMDLPSKPVFENLEPEFSTMKKKLDDAAMELEKVYGQEEIKFVVPTFYLPAIR